MLSALATNLLRLDSLSCLLTVISTLLVGRKLWQGWVVAALNSVIISIIGMRTAQFGFIPANLYAHNVRSWRRTRMPETANRWPFDLKKAAVSPVRPANTIATQTRDENATPDRDLSAAGWMVQANHCRAGIQPGHPESRSLSLLS